MSAPLAPPAPEAPSGGGPGRLGRLGVVQLARAAHPRRALATAVALAVAAAASGRAAREVGLVLATVLVGQALLGWDNDLVDEAADREDERTDKPLVTGPLDRATVGFALACGVLLVVPLSLSGGITAGICYLLSLLVALAGNRWLRRGALSWVPWAVGFALYPAFLSYGGWGGGATGHPPTIAITVAAAVLGVGVHVLTSLSGLVEDNRAGRHHLPLRLALRVGAPRLLALSAAFCLLVLAVIAWVGATVGLSQ
ncbi:UbiA family prenyltransferase [Nocardioides cynanchi]|uniref:UbiA family prenyltransferase n=1 Tax=Nocardioides cynanchi TaxID=2558918 RepID=UPI001245EAB5|nr:UbiA family prenyltransferase [Nocardioides cynanchi]